MTTVQKSMLSQVQTELNGLRLQNSDVAEQLGQLDAQRAGLLSQQRSLLEKLSAKRLERERLASCAASTAGVDIHGQTGTHVLDMATMSFVPRTQP